MEDKYKIEVETICEGQPRAYADSKYHYILKTENTPEYKAEDFCRNWLHKHRILTETEKAKMSKADIYFYGTSFFSNKGNGVYEYIVNEPFCD